VIRILFWLCVVIVLFGFYVSGMSLLEDRAANGASHAMIYFPVTMGAAIVFAIIVSIVRFTAAGHLGHAEKMIGMLLAVVIVPAVIAAFALMKQH
jgi:hypothetical protein